MNIDKKQTQRPFSSEEGLLQEIIGLRSCLHQAGLNASDQDILRWLSTIRRNQSAGRSSRLARQLITG